MTEQTKNLVITINHGELHAMPEVNWENIRAKCLEKGVPEERVERCLRCDGVPAGMRLEFA
jgi:hypothetical protein